MKNNKIGPLGAVLTIIFTVWLIFGLANSSREFVVTFFSALFALISLLRVYKKRKEVIAAKAESSYDKRKESQNAAVNKQYATAFKAVKVIYIFMGIFIVLFGIWMYTKEIGIFAPLLMGAAGIGFMIYPGHIDEKRNTMEPVPQKPKMEYAKTLNENINLNYSLVELCKAYAAQLEKSVFSYHQ